MSTKAIITPTNDQPRNSNDILTTLIRKFMWEFLDNFVPRYLIKVFLKKKI